LQTEKPNKQGKILKTGEENRQYKKQSLLPTLNKHLIRQIPQGTQKNIFSGSREISSSSQSSTDFPHDFFQDLLFINKLINLMADDPINVCSFILVETNSSKLMGSLIC
jgi:hypothetical protein